MMWAKAAVAAMATTCVAATSVAQEMSDPGGAPSSTHQEVTLSAKQLDRCAGYYKADPRQLRETVFTVARTKDQLFVQMMGQQTFPVYPESPDRFFYKVVDAEVTFAPPGSTPAQSMTLHQNGKEIVARRISKEEAEKVTYAFFRRVEDQRRPRKEIHLPTDVLQGYAGEYALGPGMSVTIMVRDQTLYAELTGQDAYPIYPDSRTEFFYKVVPAQITFIPDRHGIAMHLVLHQNGREIAGTRIH